MADEKPYKDLDLSKLDLSKFKDRSLFFVEGDDDSTPDPALVEKHRLDNERAMAQARETGGYAMTEMGMVYDHHGNVVVISSYNEEKRALLRHMMDLANRAIQEGLKP